MRSLGGLWGRLPTKKGDTQEEILPLLLLELKQPPISHKRSSLQDKLRMAEQKNAKNPETTLPQDSLLYTHGINPLIV